MDRQREYYVCGYELPDNTGTSYLILGSQTANGYLHYSGRVPMNSKSEAFQQIAEQPHAEAPFQYEELVGSLGQTVWLEPSLRCLLNHQGENAAGEWQNPRVERIGKR